MAEEYSMLEGDDGMDRNYSLGSALLSYIIMISRCLSSDS
jgi:hypothetical protein